VSTLQRVTVHVRRPVTTVDASILTELARLAREHFTLRFDYSDRRQTASQRRIEPYRIVNSGQRWYLVAWDLDRGDWRTFRVDRMREGMSPGPRFTPRPLTDAEVEALISRGVPVEARRHQARVLVRMPAAELAERFGRWLGTITAVDETSCVVETGADDLEMLAGYLGLLGADFAVSEPPELVSAVQALAARYAAAT
jgi:predicted DNA-binding transcriptional regulator YafY